MLLDGQGRVGDADGDAASDSGLDGCGSPEPCCSKCDPRRYQVALLFLINTLLFADQNLMAPNLSQIAQDFQLGPLERDQYLGGYVSLAFFSVGVVSSLVCGFLADVSNRLYGMAAVTIIGSSGCLATFFVQNTVDFIVARAVTGVSVGGSVPFFFSMLGDLTATEQRGRMTALASVFMGAGVGTGQIIAGVVGPSLGWRVPFLIVSVPTLFLAVLLVATTSEPRRGAKERVLGQVNQLDGFEYSESITCEKLKLLVSSPSVIMLLLQGLPGSLPWGVVLAFFNDYIAQEMNFSVELATTLVLCFGIGISGGQLFAGWLTDKWMYTRPVSLVLICCACMVFGAGPIIGILYVTWLPLWAYLLICLPSGFFIGIPGGAIKGLLINVTLPEVRGTAFAFNNLVDDLGRGLGPFLVSLIITGLNNRRDALAISMSCWAVAACVLLPLTCTLRQDLDKAEERIARNYLSRNPNHADFLADYELGPIQLDLQ